jgi:hypothetical protein
LNDEVKISSFSDVVKTLLAIQFATARAVMPGQTVEAMLSQMAHHSG